MQYVAGCCDFKCRPFTVAASHVTMSATNANFTLHTVLYSILYCSILYCIYPYHMPTFPQHDIEGRGGGGGGAGGCMGGMTWL